ncbi:amino acid permease [Pseudomonas sp. NPDC089569]|uniref:amino acid permease n=1 Tax=Pseudomonas sp. NPDC089569 TaxID=3390722 RepID=UPI003D011D07
MQKHTAQASVDAATSNTAGTEPKLVRGLANRHIQLIAIGGAIGTGLFMGAGKMIHVSGSSIVLTYAIIGFFLFFVMRALGELLLSNLNFKTFADFATHYLGEWAGFFVGWSYWMTLVIVGVADFIVIGGYFKFWFPDLTPWIPGMATLGFLFLLNIMAVKAFGEMEFWFALIKIIAIVSLIVAAVVMVATGFVSPNGVAASFSHVIEPGTMFPNGVMGFFAGFQIAIFSFAGIELLGTTAAEAKDPYKTLPKAINAVPVRVLLFYVLSLSCIIAVSSWAMVAPDKSPFVQLFQTAGLPIAAGVINFVVISSAMSAGNCDVFCSSRMLFGLSCEVDAPSMFKRLSKSAVPMTALFFSCFCMFMGTALLVLVPDLMVVFTTVSTIAAILFIFTWCIILASYLAYRAKRPDLHASSTFKMPAGVVMSWACLVFFVFVLGLLALERDTRQALVFMPLWFVYLFVMYRIQRTKKRALKLKTPYVSGRSNDGRSEAAAGI